ncbi:MAG TPA: DegT/DnrJ/EryC1/StrS family aminotransferase [Dehalococcoidia bacterium]|nr:DegT/DnrJ/EryC1/StrS family aminotransferase [Dehalococcoidia bacterium]
MIPITRPSVGPEEAQAAAEAVLSGWLSQGQRVREFEQAVATYVGARHAIATTNCTSALHLSLLAAGIGPGDEVICPSFSFIATANSIVHAGATPVFVDIDPRTYTIDPDLIEAAVTERTRAIMPVDQIGLAADISAVLEVARRHGLAVIEDAAPSLGATVGEARVGGLADFTCFSFHPRKSITTGEGGMIVTNDDGAAEFLRRTRSHGASVSDLSRHVSGTVDIEEYHELGYNFRMTDIQAAIGLVQMRRLDDVLGARRRLAQRYNALLSGLDMFETPFEPEGRRHTYQSYCIRLRTQRPRHEIMAELASEGIATRRGVMAIHLEPYYRRRFPGIHLPETERAAAETLLLPLYYGMTDAEQDLVVEKLIDAARGG